MDGACRIDETQALPPKPSSTGGWGGCLDDTKLHTHKRPPFPHPHPHPYFDKNKKPAHQNTHLRQGLGILQRPLSIVQRLLQVARLLKEDGGVPAGEGVGGRVWSCGWGGEEG
jgi:hypothetical protein